MWGGSLRLTDWQKMLGAGGGRTKEAATAQALFASRVHLPPEDPTVGQGSVREGPVLLMSVLPRAGVVSSRVGNCVNYAAAQPFIPISTTDFTNTALVSEPFLHIKTVFGSPRSNLSEQRSSSQHRAGCSLQWHGSLWGYSAVFREQMGLWWRSLPPPSCHLSQVWDHPPY